MNIIASLRIRDADELGPLAVKITFQSRVQGEGI